MTSIVRELSASSISSPSGASDFDAGETNNVQLLSAVEINSLNELSAYESDWDRLLAVTPDASYFLSYRWFETYWKHYEFERSANGRNVYQQRLRAILIYDSDELVGIVPLVVRREPTWVGPLRVLTYPLHSWGSFYAPIGRDARRVMTRALAHVRQTPRDWQLLDLRWIDMQADSGMTADALSNAGYRYSTTAWCPSVQIEMREGWEKYWAGRKSHWRSNVRRCERRLSERGELTHVRYRPLGTRAGDRDPRWDLYEACERIAAQSWQGSSATGTTLSHDTVRAYLCDAHAAAAEFGALDLNLLLLNQQPIAFAYNYHYRGYVYGLRIGFDPAVASEGAGTVLQRMVIEDGCRRGDQILDLGPGSAECKRHWQTRIALSARLTHFETYSPQAQMLRLLHRLKRDR